MFTNLKIKTKLLLMTISSIILLSAVLTIISLQRMKELAVNVSNEALQVKLSGDLNLNTSLFAECLIEQRYISIIANGYQDSENLNLKGSPTWFINNHPILGYVSHDDFILLVDTLLKELY